MKYIIPLLLGFSLYYYCKQSTKSTTCQLIMLTAIGFVLYSIFAQSEMFMFEVTPWKKTCLFGPRSDHCCPRGWHGQNVMFEYTNDADRLNNCNKTAEQMMMSSEGYKEGYTGGCGCG